MSHLDDWIEIAKECKYLPENDLKVSFNWNDKWIDNKIENKTDYKIDYWLGFMWNRLSNLNRRM
jgi:hypothetical protein